MEVSGGGSGTGIAALINGTVDIANCSRRWKPAEIAQAEHRAGQDPRHRRLRRAGRLRAQGQSARRDHPRTDWRRSTARAARVVRLGVKSRATERRDHPGEPAVELRNIRVLPRGHLGLGRISSSARWTCTARRTWWNWSPDAVRHRLQRHGLRDTPEVKMLASRASRARPAFAPTVENTQNGAYPIARPLSCTRWANRRKGEEVPRLDPLRRRAEDRVGDGLRSRRQ